MYEICGETVAHATSHPALLSHMDLAEEQQQTGHPTVNVARTSLCVLLRMIEHFAWPCLEENSILTTLSDPLLH